MLRELQEIYVQVLRAMTDHSIYFIFLFNIIIEGRSDVFNLPIARASFLRRKLAFFIPNNFLVSAIMHSLLIMYSNTIDDCSSTQKRMMNDELHFTK